MFPTTTFSPRKNPALPDRLDILFTAVLSDALDAVGITDQAMRPGIRPLDDTLRMAGRARTGLYAEAGYFAPDVNPYALEIAIVDDLQPGDVAVFACGGSQRTGGTEKMGGGTRAITQQQAPAVCYCFAFASRHR